MTRRVTNTTKEVGDSPTLGLALLMGGAGRGIEAMEAAGQAEFVQADQIPAELRGCSEADLERLGFKLGPTSPSDPLFRDAVLPPGWKKVATDHSMWSKILDRGGRERFSVFFKAAFYDRSARMNASCRFGYGIYEDGSEPALYAAVIRDGGVIIETIGERKSDDYEAGDRQRASCEAWLAERYPDWENPLAYWD